MCTFIRKPEFKFIDQDNIPYQLSTYTVDQTLTPRGQTVTTNVTAKGNQQAGCRHKWRSYRRIISKPSYRPIK